MYVSVDVDLEDFSDDQLVEELGLRGYQTYKDEIPKDELIESIYLKRRLGQDYQADLDRLIYTTIGRVI
jgi:hypothetical protein